MTRFFLTALALGFLAVGPVAAAPPPEHTLHSAEGVLDELSAIPLKGIPPALLADAQGVVIVPNVIKAGFLFSGRGGHGVVLTRDKNGAWGEPTFVNLGGGSVGFQAGVESTDVVLVFRTRKSLDRLLMGKGKFTLGADAAVAAGPVGREAAAATDAKLEAEILSYSRSRGLFAGVALDGAAIWPDAGTNATFVKSMTPEMRKLADALRLRLTEMSSPPPVVELKRPTPPPVIVIGPPTSPAIPVIPPAPPRP